MDITNCTTIVLVLLWLYLCCQALGFLVSLIDAGNATAIPTTTTLSIVLLGVCLWQCKNAGYLVQPMTWYHWMLLALLVVLQVMAVVLERQGWGLWNSLFIKSTHPIYAVAVVLLGILGGTLYCGWKCNLFCRPCCKSQYICYGSAIVLVLVVLVVLAVTVSLIRFVEEDGYDYSRRIDDNKAGTVMHTISYLGNMAVPCTQCYAMALIWNTILKLPYTVLEVVALIASTLAVASILAVAVPKSASEDEDEGGGSVLLITTGCPLLSVHLLALGITLYCLEYKRVFYWPKDCMCFGILAAVVILIALVAMAMASTEDHRNRLGDMSYTLLGYSMVLMVPTLWYAYRCGLLTWCFPKKKNLNGTDTAENTAADTDIAKES
ncbi:putative integral membrane protein [Babesia bovis T2Bo]|uniref:Membrane protein, putative n=1 Tax=Babesia bovis TaxID=5865 RepID=A7AMB2_BABBO|nr:putative integral membrane protein [Babesia bovis T2Bo]EDO07696.1 putative integral membrane protein [Babesia bovis T2Bo]|eukprot:XP_001611264.1 membrane protein [Babesia bovis T2Bo]